MPPRYAAHGAPATIPPTPATRSWPGRLLLPTIAAIVARLTSARPDQRSRAKTPSIQVTKLLQPNIFSHSRHRQPVLAIDTNRAARTKAVS